MIATEREQLIGTGIDLVQISAHSAQLTQPGSTFRAAYTDREWAYCTPNTATPSAHRGPASRPPKPNSVLVGADGSPHRSAGFGVSLDTEHQASLAGCWAAKEAVIKAWSAALYGCEPPISAEKLSWRHIEIVHDRWKRPAVRFHGEVARHVAAFANQRGGALRWHISISHDGDYASATAHLVLITNF
ncbi:MAG: holo-ACP synthase [Actinomycetaceae bacterium]|nr:holo-ACP synthase [Actinomycetaceae bacterium]